ncbi:ABC transporter [Salmonella enterica subsp. enterica serovar Bovismorbificans]|nr:ABC transporter [Salmonella enterica subsp. enterica serovar Bovismorbificans]
MVVTVVALIVLVQVVQMLGDWLAKRADKRDRH